MDKSAAGSRVCGSDSLSIRVLFQARENRKISFEGVQYCCIGFDLIFIYFLLFLLLSLVLPVVSKLTRVTSCLDEGRHGNLEL